MTEDSTVFGAAAQYWMDAWQRGVLFLETLNERGNIQVAQAAKEAPHVLSFPAAVVLDGRTLDRPVNYVLVRIVPPADATIDPLKPPIVVVDPRAGHGPGIGGMKPESEIGVALRAGHAVYFIGFLPKPMPGRRSRTCAASRRSSSRRSRSDIPRPKASRSSSPIARPAGRS
jgi:hypothetical protein